MSDWRDELLTDLTPLPSGGDAIQVLHGHLGRAEAVVAAWDFTRHGGSFGEADANALAAACSAAAARGLPLVTLVRTGGTRLQEGMRALVGIPRSSLALQSLHAAGVAHVSVADHPTTGGVWAGVTSVADIRIGVAGATVGFSGPRVIEATTGVSVPRGTNSAETAAAAGLLDAVLPAEEVTEWLERTLVALRHDDPPRMPAPQPVAVPDRSGWEQVEASRTVDRPAGSDLVTALLTDDGDRNARPIALCGADDTVTAALGRMHGHRAIVVALAARRAGRPSPAGFALLRRAAELAGRLDIALVTLVDCAGADPLPVSEQAGVAPGISAAMTAVLGCRAPTVSVTHGEGGSGGALAGAVTDVVGVTDLGWFAAIGPEGGAATLRIEPSAAADLMEITPRDLLANGFADALAPREPAALRGWLAHRIEQLRLEPPDVRFVRRHNRWSRPLRPRSSAAPEGSSPGIA